VPWNLVASAKPFKRTDKFVRATSTLLLAVGIWLTFCGGSRFLTRLGEGLTKNENMIKFKL